MTDEGLDVAHDVLTNDTPGDEDGTPADDTKLDDEELSSHFRLGKEEKSRSGVASATRSRSRRDADRIARRYRRGIVAARVIIRVLA